jgi:hypothetical protein
VRIQLEQRLPGAVVEVLGVLVDPAFVPRLGSLPRIGEPELLDHRADQRTVAQRVRYRFTGDLPGAVTAILDPSRLTWVDEVTYDLEAATATFRIVPDHYADRLTCAGTYTLLASGGGSVRRVEGELKVRYPIVGGRVERAIHEGIEEHLAAEASLIAATLAEPG